MPKTLDNFDFESAKQKSRAGHPQMYDWDNLLDGKVKLLVQGEDFTYARNEDSPTPDRARAFINTARSELSKRKPDHKLRAAVVNKNQESDPDNGTDLVIQAVKMTQSEREKRDESARQRQETRRKNQKAQEREARKSEAG